MFPTNVVARADRISKSALLNYIHRGHAIHCGVTPLAPQPRDIPLLGAYEIAWIAKLVSGSIHPVSASALFQILRRQEPSAIHDRNLERPTYALIAELDAPNLRVTRAWRGAWRELSHDGAIVITVINLSALFGGVDAALHRAVSESRKEKHANV